VFVFAEFALGAAGIEAEVVGVVAVKAVGVVVVMVVGAVVAAIQISAPAKDSGFVAPKMQRVQREVAWVKRAKTNQNLRSSRHDRPQIAGIGVGVGFDSDSEPKAGYAWGTMTLGCAAAGFEGVVVGIEPLAVADMAAAVVVVGYMVNARDYMASELAGTALGFALVH
jgi:hypothetical protein